MYTQNDFGLIFSTMEKELIMFQVVNNPYVAKYTKDSHLSYYGGEITDLPRIVVENFSNKKPGYRDGVILVTVASEDFFSGVSALTKGAVLTGVYESRRAGEAPRKNVFVSGAPKLPAKQVEIVLYRSDVLAEGGDNFLEASVDHWEIIAINASPEVGEAPIHPDTLLHNHFGSEGGTDTNLSDEELVAMLRDSFAYWADKAMCG